MGPRKGVPGEGRARRGEPVIVVKKIDVHVHHFWGLGISGQPGQNKRPASENRRFKGCPTGVWDGQKRPF
jgi:hypothetical protein